MLQEIQALLVKAEEAIQKLVSVKVRIAAELARQVAEAPGKTLGAKKQKAISGLAQEDRKAVTNLDQFYKEKLFGSLINRSQRRRHQNQTWKQRSPKMRRSF